MMLMIEDYEDITAMHTGVLVTTLRTDSGAIRAPITLVSSDSGTTTTSPCHLIAVISHWPVHIAAASCVTMATDINIIINDTVMAHVRYFSLPTVCLK